MIMLTLKQFDVLKLQLPIKLEHFISMNNNKSLYSVKENTPNAINKPYKIELKKKTPIIKLQVSKLIRPQSHHTSTVKKYQSLNSSHFTSQQNFDPNQSLQRQTQNCGKNKKILTFEELYFQKIKQLRQQKDQSQLQNQKSFHNIESIITQYVRPTSCKNVKSTKNKNTLQTFKQNEITKKDDTVAKKQNSQGLVHDFSTKTPKNQNNDKFFKKSTPLQNNINQLNRSDISSVQKVQQTQKIKKVLKLKKINRTKSTNCNDSSLENKNFHIQNRSSLCSFQRPSLSPINGRSNILQELNVLKMQTPSPSTISKNHEPSNTQQLIIQIVETQIDHSKHQHVWGGRQCFFSFSQFQLILKLLGFYGQNDQEILFFVKKMWENLGGDLYGGVVKKNVIQFLKILLQQENISTKDRQIFVNQNEKNNFPNNLIQSSTLKLIKINEDLKDQIRMFYFPFRLTKIASAVKEPIIEEYIPNNPKNSPIECEETSQLNLERSIQLNAFQIKETPKEKINENKVLIPLQNNVYLETVSIKNRHEQKSPCLIPQSEDTKNSSYITDFSPKLSRHQFESFPQTILEKQQSIQNLSRQFSSQTQEIPIKSTRKALLSVDVNLGEGTLEKLVIYEDQDPYEVSMQLKERYNIDEELREKFQIMLKSHLKNLLFKIQEVSQELFEDSLEFKDHQTSTDFIVMENQSVQ